MPEFLPFIATRFERERVELSRVVAPPYDIISNALRDELYERDEHNIVRIDYSREADPYTSAAEAWVDWQGEGVLRDEPRPHFYVYTQIFRGQDGEQLSRTGVLGRLRLSEYSSGEVRPHERTYDWPKSDRLSLMEATRANISPIFGVIQEPMLLFDQTLEIATVRPAIADIDERLPDGSTLSLIHI